jgi:hypothetical protein
MDAGLVFPAARLFFHAILHSRSGAVNKMAMDASRYLKVVQQTVIRITCAGQPPVTQMFSLRQGFFPFVLGQAGPGSVQCRLVKTISLCQYMPRRSLEWQPMFPVRKRNLCRRQ